MAMHLDTSSFLARSKDFNVLPSVNSKEKIFIELQRKRALTCADIMPNGWDPMLLHFPACKNVESNIARVRPRARATKIHRILPSKCLEI